MYSVMLAAMLTTTSAAAPEWGCYGCYGCSGCHSCHGCSGYAYCHGCCGGCFGWGANAFSYGCCGGCCGGCYGCYGGCYGCYGCSCSGCWGCYGCSCSGVVVYSTCSCSGSSCTGSGGGGGGGGSAAGGGGGGSTEARTKALEEQVRALTEQNRQLKEAIQRMGGGKPGGGKPVKPEEVSTPTPAHVVIKLPENARLFVDDQPCPLTSATRSFDTPALEPGRVYYYTLRAEVTRDGRPVTDSKRVTLRAGEESVVEFGDMGALLTVGR